MKQSPDMVRLEQILRGGRIVRGGFLGTDRRPLAEIIEADRAAVARRGLTCERIAERMAELTAAATGRLGAWVDAGGGLQVRAEEHKALIVCPWPHPARCRKRITTARRSETGQTLQWTDLSIHLIGKHTFFQGRGSAFRLEPDALIDFLGLTGEAATDDAGIWPTPKR